MKKIAILAKNAQYERHIQQLLEALSQYDDARLNRRPASGGWSALQTMHHLILSEEGALQYALKKIQAPAQTIEKAGLGAAWRSFLLRLSLSLPIKFKAPKGIGTEYLPEQATFNDTRARWLDVRSRWRDFLTALPEDYAEKAVFKHPFAGRLSWPGLIAFFNTHTNRHYQQILRALR